MIGQPWPDVDVDEHGQMTCPILRCDAALYLTRIYCIPLIAEQAAAGDRAEGTDETADYAPEYDHYLLHRRINVLGGERA